jgi:hypothetical protein
LYALALLAGTYVFACGAVLFTNWNAAEAARVTEKFRMVRFAFLVPYLPYALMAGGALAAVVGWACLLPEDEKA